MGRINLICKGVHDMERSLKFFRDLGFQTSTDEVNPSIVFFNNEGSKLELFPLAELAHDINPDNPPALPPAPTHIETGELPLFTGVTLACNFKSEAEVDEFMARARAAGALVAKEPQRVFWGGYSGYFVDPDGHYWEVAYGPDWKFDGQNMLVID